MSLYDIYCDESCHLQNGRDKDYVMVIGGIACPDSKKKELFDSIREIKRQYSIYRDTEIKWNKVSPAKVDYYKSLVDFFFNNDNLTFRAIVINKRYFNLDNINLSHEDFYYRAYFMMLSRFFSPGNEYSIYIDIKDTRSQNKVERLHNTLCNSQFDFDHRIITKVQQIQSHEVELMGLTDLLIGALSYANRGILDGSAAKIELINVIKGRSGFGLISSTLPLEPKFNILVWNGKNN